MTTCAHTDVMWVSRIAGWSEKDMPSRGEWHCTACRTTLAMPMGSGWCRACERPIDDHVLVGTELMQCRRPA